MKTPITKIGEQLLRDELQHLKHTERPAVITAISEARAQGDLSENAEYDAAKEAQGLLESKIAQLKGLIASARIIDEAAIGTDTVQIMNKVTIRNVQNKKEMTYTLVSESEADLKSGKIAVNTPIAQGLMGKKVGDIAEIQVPSGLISFEIINISI